MVYRKIFQRRKRYVYRWKKYNIYNGHMYSNIAEKAAIYDEIKLE